MASQKYWRDDVRICGSPGDLNICSHSKTFQPGPERRLTRNSCMMQGHPQETDLNDGRKVRPIADGRPRFALRGRIPQSRPSTSAAAKSWHDGSDAEGLFVRTDRALRANYNLTVSNRITPDFDNAPVENSAQDRFGFDPCAQSIARCLLALKSPLGSVVAIRARGPYRAASFRRQECNCLLAGLASGYGQVLAYRMSVCP